jgi:LPXTG-motif cell wall-anchored protein
MRLPTNMRRVIALGSMVGLSVVGFGAGTTDAQALPCAGVWTTVFDDQGNQQQACVAQEPSAVALVPASLNAAAVATAPAAVLPQVASVAVGAKKVDVVTSARRRELPTTGAGAGVGIIIGAVLVLAGSATSLFARRRS